MSSAKNKKKQTLPYKLVDGYKVDFQKSEEENMKLYIQHSYAKFGKLWFNRPLTSWWKMSGECFGILFDVYDERETDLPFVLVPFVYIIFTGLIIGYAIIYIPIVILYLIIWLPSKNKREENARLEIALFLDSLPVRIENELIKSERELERISKIKEKGDKNFTAFQEEIESNSTDHIDQVYGDRISKSISWYEGNLHLLQLIIEQIGGNIKELKIWKTLEKAERDFKEYGNQFQPEKIARRQAFFIRSLEEMKRDRTLAEEVEIFDLTEGLKLKLEALRDRNNQRLN